MSIINKVGGNSLTHEEAMKQIISQSGIKYDPSVVASFVELNK